MNAVEIEEAISLLAEQSKEQKADLEGEAVIKNVENINAYLE